MKKLDFGKIADKLMPAPLRYYWDNRSTSPVGYRIAHGAFWSMIGTGIPQALTMISSIFVARLLGKDLLGEYGMVISTVGLFNMFAFFGIGMTSIKHVAEFRKNDPAKAGRIIALFYLLAAGSAVLMIGALIPAAPWLAERTLAAPHLANLMRIGAGIIFFGAFSSVQMGTLAGLEAFRTIAWITILNGVLLFPLLVGGVYFFGLPGAVVGYVISGAVGCIISNIEIHKAAREAGVPIRFTGCTKELYILLEFSLPAVLGGVMFTPANWACMAMLVNIPKGYAEMGIFGVAGSWQKVIFFIPQCLNAIALPMLSDFHGTKQRIQYLKTFWYSIILIGISALGVAIAIAVASPFIMKIYGAGFLSGKYVLMFMSFSAVIIVIDNFVGVAILSIGKMWFLVATAAVWAITSITASYFLVPLYGAIGLSLAMAAAYVLHVLCDMLYIARFYGDRSR